MNLKIEHSIIIASLIWTLGYMIVNRYSFETPALLVRSFQKHDHWTGRATICNDSENVTFDNGLQKC